MDKCMSYHYQPKQGPPDNRTLHQVLDDNTAKHPDKEFLVYYDANQQRSSLTFQQLKDQSIVFAGSLLQHGFKRGDRILLYARNSLEFLICWMAMSRIGVCAALKYFNENKWESFELMKRIKCSGLIVGMNVPDEQRMRIVDEIMEITQSKNEKGEPYAKAIITIGETDADINHPNIVKYENLIDNNINQAEVIAAGSEVDTHDIAFVFFTSGTTSATTNSNGSKCVAYTHHAVISGLKSTNAEPSVSFYYKPMAWGYGITAIVSSLLSCSKPVCTAYSKLTIQDNYKHMFDIVQAEKCVRFSIPIQHVFQLLAEKFYEKYDISQAVGWGFGSQTIPRKTVKCLLDAIPDKKAVLLYATSETLLVALQPLYNETVSNKDDYGKMYIVQGIEVKVVDDEGQVVPLETKGRIFVRGPKVFVKYLEDPAGTSKAKTPDGWVNTCDYGIMYDRARLKVLGRQTDLIFTKDQAVFPVEVEEIFLEYPDAQEAVVVGIPNEDNKEDICACVIQVPGSNLVTRVNELGKWCQQAFDASNKHLIPKYVVFFESFPILISGKINRSAIKQLAQDKQMYTLN